MINIYMTTGPKTATPITTGMLCTHGCGNVAKFISKRGKNLCCSSANSCPEIKKKNSKGLALAHKEGRAHRISIPWNKGLSSDTDDRVKNNSIVASAALREGYKSGNIVHIGIPCTDERREKLREARLKCIASGKYDTSGRKGHRGYYDSMYFHSSWELAFYVYNKEIKSIVVLRNTSKTISYMYNNRAYKYIPDFEYNNSFIEIKGYLFSERDKEKYNQTKNNVRYVFEQEIIPMISYCKEKYGNQFWEILYE